MSVEDTEPLQLELEVVVGSHVGTGNELRYSVKEASALNQ